MKGSEKMAEEKVQKQQQAVKPKNKGKTVDKWKKKSWYTIFAPLEFERKEIGETVAEKPEMLIGRTVTITGRELANQAKKNHFTLKFRVKEVAANKAFTEAFGHEIKESYMRRVVRRRTSKVMVVNNYVSKDNASFRVKIVAVTDRACSGPQKTAVRKKLEEAAKKTLSEIDSKKMIDEMVFGNVSNSLYAEAKKIVPIKRVEIVSSALLKK